MERLCHILRLAMQLGVYWLVEQPASSAPRLKSKYAGIPRSHAQFCRFASQVLRKYRAMRNTLKVTGAKRVSFWMCCYGAPSVKPTAHLGYMFNFCTHGYQNLS